MLEGKVAVVTGASRGIGKAIALKLASQGAKVVINYNGSEEKAKEVQAQIETEGGKAVIYRCDVSDYGACQTFIQDVIKTEGSMDILVNNAGITRDGLLMKMSEEDFDRVIDTNLKGAFHTIRFAARQMLKQRSGRIINMASVVGVTGNAGQANYAASKAGGVECVVCVKTIQDGFIHQTVGTTETDEECDLDYAVGAPVEKDVNYVLTNSLGFGGHNATLLLKRYEG